MRGQRPNAFVAFQEGTSCTVAGLLKCGSRFFVGRPRRADFSRSTGRPRNIYPLLGVSAQLITNANQSGEIGEMKNRASVRRNRRPDICVILNGGSGKRDSLRVAERIRAAFKAAHVPMELDFVEDGSDISNAARAAVDKGFSTIVAAGGDGTICAVAAAVRNSGCKMGIIPLGTFNYFARSLDLPDDIEGAVDVLLSGGAKSVPVGTINDRVFLNNASLGVYPEILKKREDIYKRWGRSRVAAYWSVLKTLITLRRPLKLRIETETDNRRVHTPLLFAVNNAFQLDQIGLEGRDDVAQGKLVLFIAPNSGRWGILRHALALSAGTAEPKRNFEMLASEHIRIHAGQGARLVACDGERMRMHGPFDMRVHKDELFVIAPNTRKTDVR